MFLPLILNQINVLNKNIYISETSLNVAFDIFRSSVWNNHSSSSYSHVCVQYRQKQKINS